MSNLRAWLKVNGGVLLVLVAVGAIVAAILLSPPLPPREPGFVPPSTAAYGQPGQLDPRHQAAAANVIDTMLDVLEGRVYTLETVIPDYQQRIAELEARVEKLERSRR